MPTDHLSSTAPPVVLITGAARRIGRAIAKALHSDGASLIIHYHHSQQEAEALCEELNACREQSAVSYRADLANPDAIDKLVNFSVKAWGRIDSLIHNASVFSPDPKPLKDKLAHWQHLMDTNARAAFQLSHALQDHLAERQGCIINLIDIYAERPLSQFTSYTASKAASSMLVKSMALDFAPKVRVNGISPGAILWPETAADDPAMQQRLLNNIPLARLGGCEPIVEAIRFLHRCDYITGQIIAIDGGRSLTI